MRSAPHTGGQAHPPRPGVVARKAASAWAPAAPTPPTAPSASAGLPSFERQERHRRGSSIPSPPSTTTAARTPGLAASPSRASLALADWHARLARVSSRRGGGAVTAAAAAPSAAATRSPAAAPPTPSQLVSALELAGTVLREQQHQQQQQQVTPRRQRVDEVVTRAAAALAKPGAAGRLSPADAARCLAALARLRYAERPGLAAELLRCPPVAPSTPTTTTSRRAARRRQQQQQQAAAAAKAPTTPAPPPPSSGPLAPARLAELEPAALVGTLEAVARLAPLGGARPPAEWIEGAAAELGRRLGATPTNNGRGATTTPPPLTPSQVAIASAALVRLGWSPDDDDFSDAAAEALMPGFAAAAAEAPASAAPLSPREMAAAAQALAAWDYQPTDRWMAEFFEGSRRALWGSGGVGGGAAADHPAPPQPAQQQPHHPHHPALSATEAVATLGAVATLLGPDRRPDAAWVRAFWASRASRPTAALQAAAAAAAAAPSSSSAARSSSSPSFAAPLPEQALAGTTPLQQARAVMALLPVLSRLGVRPGQAWMREAYAATGPFLAQLPLRALSEAAAALPSLCPAQPPPPLWARAWFAASFPRLPSASPAQLAGLAAGAAALRHAGAAALPPSSSASGGVGGSSASPATTTSTTTTDAAAAAHWPQLWLRELEAAALATLSDSDDHQLAAVLDALARLRHAPSRLYLEGVYAASHSRLRLMGPAGLARVARSLAELGAAQRAPPPEAWQFALVEASWDALGAGCTGAQMGQLFDALPRLAGGVMGGGPLVAAAAPVAAAAAAAAAPVAGAEAGAATAVPAPAPFPAAAEALAAEKRLRWRWLDMLAQVAGAEEHRRAARRAARSRGRPRVAAAASAAAARAAPKARGSGGGSGGSADSAAAPAAARKPLSQQQPQNQQQPQPEPVLAATAEVQPPAEATPPPPTPEPTVAAAAAAEAPPPPAPPAAPSAAAMQQLTPEQMERLHAKRDEVIPLLAEEMESLRSRRQQRSLARQQQRRVWDPTRLSRVTESERLQLRRSRSAVVQNDLCGPTGTMVVGWAAAGAEAPAAAAAAEAPAAPPSPSAPAADEP